MIGAVMQRRRWLGAALGGWAAATLRVGRAAETGLAPGPRATDGDEPAEPTWDERLSVSVGPSGADIVGTDERAIQAAVEYVARLGGGTVHLRPGTFTLRNAVRLPSRIRLVGSGPETVITKIPSVAVPLAADSDWYDREITLADAAGFRVGDGVVLVARKPAGAGTVVIKRTLVARSGGRFRLDAGLRDNLWSTGQATCATQFPLLTAERAGDIAIERLVLDGNRDGNVPLDGNHAGCVFLQDCARVTLRGVEARNYNGDGISFQICHDVVVEECHVHGHAGACLHPGSGSQRPVIRGCRMERSGTGLFWCWGVRFGLAEGNRIADHSNCGISIGHNDCDNVIRGNEITGSGRRGILFRDDERGRGFWPHRNLVERNRVVDTGGNDPGGGIAIDVQGQPADVTIVDNELVQTGTAPRGTGIRVAPGAVRLRLEGNQASGFTRDVEDLRP